jgi:class 3 adenylate cyclase
MAHVVDRPAAEAARAALERHDWQEAYDALSAADQAAADEPGSGLSPHELELLGDSAWWVGRLNDSIEARERAFAAYLKDGEKERAAGVAARLAGDNLVRATHPQATAWLRKAERLLQDRPETPATGWVALTRGMKAFFEGDVAAALADSSLAQEVGIRFGDADLQAMALNAEGRCLVAMGRVDEGMAIMDEAAMSAVTGELQPFTAGGVYCATIGACAALGDWERALQWTDAQDRWCRREQITGFPGMCRLHRAELKRVRGSWLEAEAEARRASEELASFIPSAVPAALYEIGEIKLRRGDFAGAEELLLRAHTIGRDPEPALSLLRLAEGKVDAALSSINRALEHPARTPMWTWSPPDSPLWRLGLLPAKVEIALAAGQVAAAHEAADELSELAITYRSVSVRAAAACAQGAVALAEERVADARVAQRTSLDLWKELDAPYEMARCRLLLAEALHADGDDERAVLELQVAREAFASLGAMPDVRRTDELLASLDAADARAGDGGAARRSSVRPSSRLRRAFMFTDIVDSTRLLELVGDEQWEHLSRWHDETIRSLIAQHGGEEVKTIGDGFFVAFQRVPDAVRCAVAIQRALVAHRTSSGFAPEVRIGIHLADASHRGNDYAGKGVNEAARIGALAVGGEVLISVASVDGTNGQVSFGVSNRRSVTLKGITEPVEVATVDWR